MSCDFYGRERTCALLDASAELRGLALELFLQGFTVFLEFYRFLFVFRYLTAVLLSVLAFRVRGRAPCRNA